MNPLCCHDLSLCNALLIIGCFPSNFKQDVICPLLKKSGLDTSYMKNFRPVSNLLFLSKLLERIVQCRLQAFLDSKNMMPLMQSAYRRFHSTETPVTTVYSDLLLAAVCQLFACLTLLLLSTP